MKLIFLILCLLWGFVRDSYSEDIVRLLKTWSSRRSYYGIIQIRYDNTWATVLDYDEHKMEPEIMLNAYVVCRSLSYVKVEKVDRAFTVDYDPRGANKTQWPRRLRCSGREDTIKDCYNFSNVDLDNPPSKAVYVECGALSDVEKTLQARLVNFYPKNVEPENLRPYGIVELRYNPNFYFWKKICVANSLYGWQWDTRDANVVCKMLGYNRAIKGFIFKIPKSEDPGNARRYHCSGKEATLAYCAQSVRRNKCKKEDDYYAGAFCEENAKLPPVSYRVYSTNEPNDGYLEVQYRGAWGTACSELDRTSSDFVCRESGYLGSYEPTSYYPRSRQDPPMTEISWELNESCNISSGNCSHGDMWRVQRYSPCERPFKITCKVANIPQYDVISGCPPKLIINRQGLTEKEKKLISYYQVVLGGNRYFGPRWSVFYIPGNTTTLVLGDGKKYVKGLNKPLETGKTHYIYLTGVYAKKISRYEERFGYGDYVKYGLKVTVVDCPTSPAPTNMTDVSSTSNSEPATHISALTGNKLNAEHIAGIVICVLLFIVIAVIIIFVYKKRNHHQDYQNGPEQMKLNPVPVVTKV